MSCEHSFIVSKWRYTHGYGDQNQRIVNTKSAKELLCTKCLLAIGENKDNKFCLPSEELNQTHSTP